MGIISLISSFRVVGRQRDVVLALLNILKPTEILYVTAYYAIVLLFNNRIVVFVQPLRYNICTQHMCSALY